MLADMSPDMGSEIDAVVGADTGDTDFGSNSTNLSGDIRQ